MGNYSIAASKNCTRELGHVVNIEIVNAIQRTAAKTWVSDQLYDHDMCTLDFDVLLIDVPNLHATKYIEALQWWVKILDLKDDRSKKIHAAIALTLYNSYHELPSFWKIHEPVSSEDIHKSITNILRYDGPTTRVCSGDMKERQESNSSNIWLGFDAEELISQESGNLIPSSFLQRTTVRIRLFGCKGIKLYKSTSNGYIYA